MLDYLRIGGLVDYRLWCGLSTAVQRALHLSPVVCVLLSLTYIFAVHVHNCRKQGVLRC